MKDLLAILWIECQIILYRLLTCFADTYTKLTRHIPRFVYLYLMDDYKKMQYRNSIAALIKEMRSKDDSNMDLAIEKTTELYKWMCQNQ